MYTRPPIIASLSCNRGSSIIQAYHLENETILNIIENGALGKIVYIS